MRGLQGKGVLVTGGTRGIGLAAATRFLEEGCRVFVCGHDQRGVDDALAALRPLGDVAAMTCDVSLETEVAELVEAAASFLGRIDALANNAGIAVLESFLDVTPASWDETLAVNLRGNFLVAQAVARRMAADGQGGAIVNMSSVNGLMGEVNLAHYNASKGGVLLLTKTMAAELAPFGIRVNALCPGFIATPLNLELNSAEEIGAYARDKIPMGRPGLAEEIAAAYAYLCSDDASFVTGAGLVIDGGQTARM